MKWLIILFGTMLAMTQCFAEDAPATAPAPSAPTEKPEAVENTFNILEYRIEGNHALATIDIERAVYPFLGEKKTIKDVEAARLSLEKAYHDSGHLTILVNIPEQRVTSGVVKLQVLEAPVGRLHIAGSRYYSLGNIRETVSEVASGNVPDFSELQKEMGQLNRSPDMRVTPILKASATPGKVDIDMRVEDKLPLHGSLEYNDYYSPTTTHTRAIAQLSYDNLWQQGHSVIFQYQTAPLRTSDAKVYSLSYIIPTRSNLTWALYAIDSKSNVAAVGDLDVIGNGNIYGLRLIQALPALENFYESVSYGVDYKDFAQDVTLLGSDTSIHAPISYLPFSIQYSGTLNDNANNSTALDAGVNFVIRGLVTSQQQFAEKRADASPYFFIFRGGLRRTQMLPYRWSLLAKVDGQIADGPLISNEQFSAGGEASVRGYEESERLGDDGLHGTLELHTPTFGDPLGQASPASYFLVFIDGAHLRVREPLPGQDPDFTLASAGLGIRLKTKGLTLDMDAAIPQKDAVNTKADQGRVMFRANYGF